MPVYAYEALDETGSPVDGKIEVDNEMSAASRLRKLGYTVLEISEIKESSFKRAFASNRKIKPADIIFFSRQLAAMIAAGIPLTRCLYTMYEQTENPSLKQIVREVALSVEGGTSLSESLRAHPHVFSSMYVDMVKAGEISGSLEEMLKRISEQLERSKSLGDSIRSATLYPAVIVLFASVVISATMFFIVPIFMGFFPAGMPLPLPTKIVVGISNSMRNAWYLYILFLSGLFLYLRFYSASNAGQRAWDRIRFRLPVFGPLFRKAAVASFARTLSTLLSGGIPVLQALEAAGPATGSIQVAEAVKQAGEGIQEGHTIAPLLEKSGFFPPMLTNMVAVGEETGELSGLLDQVAQFYEAEVATLTKGLTTMIEPLLIIFVGLMIGGIVISVYLPIFSVVTSIGG